MLQEVEKEVLRVLVIEDDEDDFFIARNLLSKARSISCNLDWVQTYEEGMEKLLSEPYDVSLIDYRLGPRDGLPATVIMRRPQRSLSAVLPWTWTTDRERRTSVSKNPKAPKRGRCGGSAPTSHTMHSSCTPTSGSATTRVSISSPASRSRKRASVEH